MNKLTSPTPDEYAEFHAGYIICAKARDDVLAALPKQIDEIKSSLGKLTDEQAHFRDAPKEWSIRKVMGHLNDVERVFSYRLLRISRDDDTRAYPGTYFVSSRRFRWHNSFRLI